MSVITKQTFDFLKQIGKNNSREWFQENKSTYEKSHEEVIAFADKLIDLVNSFDVLDTQSGKKALYRIYRDTRFSKDKTPYKTMWGGYLRRSGAMRRGGFHFDIEPNGKSFIGGGFWSPNKEDLLLVRQQIEADASPLRNVIESSDFKSFFHELKGAQLKTAPKGFDKEHEEIDLLRYKQFLVKHDFTDKEVLSSEYVHLVAEGFKNMLPFFDVMTEYLTTDLNGLPVSQ